MNRRGRGFPVAGILFLAIAGCHSGLPSDKVAELVAKVTHGTAAVRTVFDGPPGSGLTGAVIAGGTHAPVVVWITPDGKTLIAGNLFDARGRNLTRLATLRLADVPIQTPAPSSVAAAASGPPSPVPLAPEVYRTMVGGVRSLREGAGKKSLWIFLDPNCPWCRRLYADLRAHPLPADVSVNWVPVAFLKPSSVGRAETLLSKGLPALERNEDRFDESTEDGGAPETHRPDLESAVKENTRILVAAGGTKTPTLVFRDDKDGFRRFDGYPTPEGLSWILSEAQ
ncbi:MAG: thioredoxin fold domain-containing protein [Nitrospiraceae bacterium]|nr:thioredoxin fold domain-containing protein [Nitrospiraceae bacterium]